jgi:hypothetical protein
LIATISLTWLISVLLPYKIKSICSLRSINICITLIVSLCYLVNIHILVGLGLKEEGHCAQIGGIYNTFVVKIMVNLENCILYPCTRRICDRCKYFNRSTNCDQNHQTCCHETFTKTTSFRATKILTIWALFFSYLFYI